MHAATHRKEDHQKKTFYEDQIARPRRHRADRLEAIGVERKLNRSYATFEECQRKATAVFAGARIARTPVAGAMDPSDILNLTGGQNVYQIGDGSMVIDGVGDDHHPATDFLTQDIGSQPERLGEKQASPRKASKPKVARSPKVVSNSPTGMTFGRPQNPKDLLE